ncbi:M13 family metallopeptidase [Acidicapsa ligni]|uniref:M13 family metallopeptidase n=1 Tax=Acidicapsa ligni TaxID=542300 RepID=UPI0021E037E9|nr:M13 family metallopeptidase [Acidicapsa ligni]
MNLLRPAFTLAVASALLAATSAFAQSTFATPDDSSIPTQPKSVRSLDLDSIDKTADPCTDFYQYACGNWVKDNPIPGDQTRWMRSFSTVGEHNRYLLWQELDAAAKAPKTPLEKKYGDYYGACMDTSLIEQKGLTPLSPALSRIASLSDAKKLSTLMGELLSAGSPAPLFSFSVGQDEKDSSKQIAETFQDGLSLPDRDYYLVDSEHFKTIREEYVAHVTKMFTLAGDTPEKAATEAATVLRIETALAKGSTSRTDLREPQNRYHIYTVAQLEEITPNFAWPVYWKAIGIRHFDSLNVATPEFFKTVNQLIATEPVDAWKAYFRWHTIHSLATNLPKSFFDENFAFFGKTLAGQAEPTPRWKQCTSGTDQALGEAVGQDWVKENFPPQAKESMDKLVAALEKSLGDDIRTLPWMTEPTRKAAEEKLNLIRNKIGYPEKWRDYSALTIHRDDLIGNINRTSIFSRNYELDKLGKPVDEKEWGMTPPTVNAYYDPSMNDINFPAGILQPPFFDFKADPAVNFGGIGVVIGHEMTHGFDDQGSKYDGHGNLREWQTADDRKAFTERTDCEVAEYSGFEASPAHDDQPAQNLNGKLTLGENTADNGGLRIAYLALLDTLASEGKTIDDKIDGYTEAQRYFLSFGQVWCQNQTDKSARQSALVDPHSPGRWRTNGSVQNFDEFGKAFGCKKGQPMYPEHSCRVW